MHRAAYLARLSSVGRVFLTTFSKTLASRLADGMNKLLGPNSEARGRVEVIHLHAYAFSEVSRSGHNTIAEPTEIDRLIQEKRGALDAFVTNEFLRTEWDQVVDYWGLKQWEDYRDIARTGRGTALTQNRRRELWTVFDAVLAELNARHAMTWGELCDRFRVKHRTGYGSSVSTCGRGRGTRFWATRTKADCCASSTWPTIDVLCR